MWMLGDTWPAVWSKWTEYGRARGGVKAKGRGVWPVESLVRTSFCYGQGLAHSQGAGGKDDAAGQGTRASECGRQGGWNRWCLVVMIVQGPRVLGPLSGGEVAYRGECEKPSVLARAGESALDCLGEYWDSLV